jgi:N-acetylmuramoyl-L-alanine amidase
MIPRAFSRLLQVGLLLAAPALPAANQVQTVTLDGRGADGARLLLELAAAPNPNVFALEAPHRIVIDLKSTTLARGLRLPQGAGPVSKLRTSLRPDGTTLRVVMELDRPLDPKVAVSGTQLTIELGKAGMAPAASVVPAASVPVRAAHAPVNTGRDIIVAVDAGHGGADPGASGAKGTREKNVVLAIARALARRIDAEPGMKAVLTRDSDKFIELRERGNLARRAGADIFISVHADAIKNRQVSGSSVYVLNERGATSEGQEWLAELAEQQNAVDLKGGVSLANMEDSLASVLMDVSQTASMARSLEAAGRVLGQLDRVGTIRKTQVQQARFMVLRSRDIPSLLVETAYISNPEEERKLNSPQHQADIAEASFNGVREYFRQNPPDGTLYAQQRAARNAGANMVADRSGP